MSLHRKRRTFQLGKEGIYLQFAPCREFISYTSQVFAHIEFSWYRQIRFVAVWFVAASMQW